MMIGRYTVKNFVPSSPKSLQPTAFGPIGIGGSLAAPPLPHHRAYGSVHGGSAD